mmetsp:Transcript_24681/g.72587  ORF Transcript_24681/g.72587 Transcript_24681/m.72587 type:complete len:178 (-) Transcript_24681:253-786(-)
MNGGWMVPGLRTRNTAPTDSAEGNDDILLDEREQEQLLNDLHRKNENDALRARRATGALTLVGLCAQVVSLCRAAASREPELALAAHLSSILALALNFCWATSLPGARVTFALAASCIPLVAWARILGIRSDMVAEAWKPFAPLSLAMLGWYAEFEHNRCRQGLQRLHGLRYHHKTI